MISPRPAPEGTPNKPGFPQIPFFGVDLALLDNKVPTPPKHTPPDVVGVTPPPPPRAKSY